MSEEKKQRPKEYQKNYREAKKSQYNNEQFFNYDLIVIHTVIFFNWDNTCYYFSFVLLNRYIYVILDRPTKIKSYVLQT